MNAKIDKLRTERSKHTKKIELLQTRVKEIDLKITELENVDIVDMVRERGVTPEMLAELLKAMYSKPIPAESRSNIRMEDTHEEN